MNWNSLINAVLIFRIFRVFFFCIFPNFSRMGLYSSCLEVNSEASPYPTSWEGDGGGIRNQGICNDCPNKSRSLAAGLLFFPRVSTIFFFKLFFKIQGKTFFSKGPPWPQPKRLPCREYQPCSQQAVHFFLENNTIYLPVL